MPKVDPQYLQARRRQIMDAALTCFAREGFHRATMQEIIRETGLSAGAIYRYFDSKEDIVGAIAEEHRALERRVLENARERADVREVLRELITVSLGRLGEAGERRWRRVTIQLWSEALRDARILRIVRGGLDGPVEQLAAVIRRAQREGAISDRVDPTALARVCASIFQGLVLQLAWDPSVDVGAYVETVHAIATAIAPGRGQAAKARTSGRRSAPRASAGRQRVLSP